MTPVNVALADTPPSLTRAPRERLESLDVLRGFDMFMIVGFDRIVRAFCPHVDHPLCKTLQEQFTHVEWEGFRFYDLIFPLFLFIIGVAIPFSVNHRLQRGDPRVRIYAHLLLRVVVLVFLGMIVNGNLLTYDPAQFQITYSVLQMLALGYLVASVFYLNLRLRGQIVASAALLLIYYLLQNFVPVPGHEMGVLRPRANFGDWLNDLILGDLQGRWRLGWILGILTHASTAMLGVFAGQVLLSTQTEKRKVLWLWGLGLACLSAGYLWGCLLPSPLRFAIVKDRWTSTFVLFAGGWSFLLLGLFYLVVDVWRLRRWGFFFKVIGVNAIFAYMATALFWGRGWALGSVAEVFLGGLKPYVGIWHETLVALGTSLVLWLILLHLYRCRIFLKI
ncbi:MAG: DUF5009 domain-containing protein [Planctomycetes bacterium]|jgi:predicted acyltransferase|nr:DUF5009 domain-containing protein [Planctomycetota bacterium]